MHIAYSMKFALKKVHYKSNLKQYLWTLTYITYPNIIKLVLEKKLNVKILSYILH